jgi:hypothetical protein
MPHQEGASDPLVAIQGRLDKIDNTLVGHGHMLKMHGIHFGTLEAMLSEHTALLIAHDARFDQVDARFDQVDARFDQVDAQFDQVDEMLGKILARLDAPRP